MNYHAVYSGYYRQLLMAMYAILKYNYGGVSLEWVEEYGPRILTDGAGQTVVEEVQVFAGNQIQALDMYNTFWDPTVHPVNLHKDGEFAARISRRSTYWLQQRRSEEHTSELQSLMRISYAVFCLKKKNKKTYTDKEKS